MATTYAEAVKRARMAYSFNKNAAEKYDDSKHPAQTPEEIFAAQERNAEEGKAESNRIKSKKEYDAALEKNRQAGIDESNRINYMREYQKGLAENEAAGKAMSNLISTEKATGGSGLNDEQLLLMAANGSLPPELAQAAEAAQARVAAKYTDQKNGIVNRAQGEQAVRDIAQQKANRNLGISAGAGLLGGAAVGAGAYGLAGLFPSLKKRRLLRALVALGVGAGAGAGIGYGVNRGLNSGKINIG